MKCPICGQAELVRDTRDVPYTYKGHTTIIKGITGDYCQACGEAIYSYEETGRLFEAMKAFKQKIDPDQVEPEFIEHVRKKLALNQREAGELFGGGINAFSRYETGKATPPRPLVQLFKLLDRHPELMDELKSA
jgi:HTH-type transcriptional regulator/antitoxin MqsA